MPYSKDPMKYPYGFEVFLKGLEGRREVKVVQRFAQRADAVRNRVQMQNYLAAVCRKAGQMERESGGFLMEQVKIGKTNQEEAAKRLESFRTEQAKWDSLARVAEKLQVRAFESGGEWVLEIATRSAGAFEDALVAAVGGQAAVQVKMAAGAVRPEVLNAQDAGKDWLMTGKSSAKWLEGATWVAGDEAGNLQQLAEAFFGLLGDAKEAAKQTEVVNSLAIFERQRAAQCLIMGLLTGAGG